MSAGDGITIGNQSTGSGSILLQTGASLTTSNITVGNQSGAYGGITAQDDATISATGNLDFAVQSSASAGALFDSATVNVGGYITVGDGGSAGITIQDSATVSAGDGITIGNQSTGSGSILLQTGASLTTSNITVGNQSGAYGGITAQDDATISATGNLDFAVQSSASAGALFDSATVNVGGYITVGDGGSAGITIQDSATVSASGVVVGNQSGGSGSFKVQTGATVSAGVLNLGGALGATGLATFDSATVNVSGYLTIGLGGSGGLLVQDGAQVTVGGLTLGYQSGSFGGLEITGSDTDFTVDPNDDATLGTVIGYQGSGTLLVTDEATFDPGSFIALGVVAGGAGELDIDQGISVETDNIGIGGTPAGGGGSGTVNVAADGAVTADQTIGLFTGTINVASGGSVDIGTDTDSIAGAVHVGADGTFAQLPGTGTISGNFVDDGNVAVSGALNVTGSTTINDGGTVTVYNGGSVSGTIVDNGSLVFDVASTDTFSGTLTGSGSLTVEGGGTLVLGGGDAFTGNITISGNSTLELTSATAAGSGSITFGDPNNTLKIDGNAMPTNVIGGFMPGDTIDLAGVQFDALSGATLFEDDNVIQIAEDGQTYNLALSGDYSGRDFLLAPGTGNVGTQISVSDVGSDVAGSTLITPPSIGYSTAAYPYNGVVYIQANLGPAKSDFSGIIIGPHTILTVAHGLLLGSQQYSNMTISGSFGSIGVVNGQSAYIRTELTTEPTAPNPNDYGIIEVSQTLPFYDELATTSYGGGIANLTGYPPSNTPGTQYSEIGGDLVTDAGLLAFTSENVQALEGSSGGAVWT